jgi:hypothetical protein
MVLRFAYLQKKQIFTKLGIILSKLKFGDNAYTQESKDARK